MPEVVVEEVQQFGRRRLRLDVDGDPEIDAVAVDHADLEVRRVRRTLSAPFDGVAPQNTVVLQRHDPPPLVDARRCARANADRDPSMRHVSEPTRFERAKLVRGVGELHAESGADTTIGGIRRLRRADVDGQRDWWAD